MAKLLVMYKKPADPAAFDAYYFNKHVPIAKKIPGLKLYEVSTGPLGGPGPASPHHMIAALSFDSMEALQKGMGSPEGAAAEADLPNFAMAGADVLVFETRQV